MRQTLSISAVAVCALAGSAFADNVLDLTTSVNAWGQINGAIYENFNTGNSGTGTFPAFLQIQHDGSEQGYNTSGNPKPFDDGSSSQHNHNLQMSDLVLSQNGLWYEFTLDLNETQSEPTINLTALRIYTDTRGSLTFTDFSFQSLRYDMDAGVNSTVLMDTSITNSGSGMPDMRVSIPVSDFAGAASTDFVYLYAAFDLTSDGFEEWGLRSGGVATNPIPAPGAAGLLATSVIFAGARRRRR